MGEPEAKIAGEPWYQSTLLWGCIGAFLAIVLTVVAAMMKDIRWLLFVAWPFAIFCRVGIRANMVKAYRRLADCSE
jgi:hypothetical protein